MEGLFPIDQFRDFGVSSLAPAAGPPGIERVQGRGPSKLRSEIRLLCPTKPGVYGMLDAAGELIYVGKAKQLRDRLLSYFRTGSRPPKAGRILRHAKAVVWEIGTHEFAALLREQELIRRWRPRCNIQGQPLRRRLAFLCIGRAPAPHVYLTRQPPLDAVAAIGPLPWTQRTVKVSQWLNDRFRLRDCPQPQEMIFPEQGALFPLVRAPGCLRAELGACLAPCTGTCHQADYGAAVQAAVAFLAGFSAPTVDDLECQMRAAAAAQQFERAAALRDQWTGLTWLVEQLARLRHAQESMSFIYPLVGWDHSAHWYLIHGARVLGSVPAPRDLASAKTAAAAIIATYQSKKLGHLLAPYEHHDGRLVVMQWFRQHARERNKTLTPGAALAVCEKWGKTPVAYAPGSPRTARSRYG